LSEIKLCPKCGTEMKRGKAVYTYGRWKARLGKGDDFWGGGNNIIPLYCEKCGYIELYDEKTIGEK